MTSGTITETEVPIVSVTLNGQIETLPQVIEALQGVDDLWHLCHELGLFIDAERAGADPRDPRLWTEIHPDVRAARGLPRFDDLAHVRIRKQSPLWLEVGQAIWSPAGVGAAGLGLMAWCLRHPSEIATFLPSLKEHWHKGWLEAEMAEEALMKYRERAVLVARAIEDAMPGDVEVSDSVPNFDFT